MSVVALALLGIGVADVVRLRRWAENNRGVVVAILAGLSVIALLAVLADLTSGADVPLLLVASGVLCAWVLTTREDRHPSSAIPLGVLAGGFALLLLGSGGASDANGAFIRWLSWTDLPSTDSGVSPDKVLLIAGLLLVQVASANTVVRLVLTQIGALGPAGSPQASDCLRGGRILGPMERLIILGLGLAGEVTAASLVIAAKGLIRWPELRQSDLEEPDSIGVDEVTEYFLVGSMVSWLLSLTALAVATLA